MTRRTLAVTAATVGALFIVTAATLGAAAPGADEPSPAQDGTLPALTAIAGQGMMDLNVYHLLEELSDDIGGRVTGTPQCNRAIQWGLATMKAIGLQNVHAEPWQIARGWTRGSASAEMMAPAHHPLMVDAMGWVGSTPPGGVDADVVPVNVYQLKKEIDGNPARWRGKVLLTVQKGDPPKDRSAMFGEFGSLLIKAHEAGAVAVIGGQGGGKSAGMHLTHTGALGFN
ncbi:MAG TPA: hypothetical protein VND92_04460, partial [Vicinamibacterales bacterium]|nr:hypothetical protein [Vicinamibacterales bacterium]